MTILAHVTDSGGGGGGESPLRWVLLLAAVAVISVAGRLRSGGRSPVQWAGVGALGIALAVAGLAWPASKDDHITLTVLTPEDDSMVAANQPIVLNVSVEGGRVATSDTDTTGGHLHVYVDGRLEQMPYTSTPSVTLPPGKHAVRVEYVDARHAPYKPPVEVELNLDARVPGEG